MNIKENVRKLEIFKSKKQKIAQVMGFLDIQLSKEELIALEELMEDNGTSEFEFETLHRIFLKTSDDKLREYQELLKSFEAVKPDKDQDYITIENLRKMMMEHDQKYIGSFDTIVEEIKDTDHFRDDRFYFKDYLQDTYGIKEEDLEKSQGGEVEKIIAEK